MGRLLRTYLLLIAILTIVSCLGLLIIPAELGAMTPWGAASGWQREIAFWNFSMYVLIVRTLRRRDAITAQLLATGLVVLNFLVAANHFATVVENSGATLNAIAGAINAGSGILGAIALWQTRAAGPEVTRS
jgi:hypothetical protein